MLLSDYEILEMAVDEELVHALDFARAIEASILAKLASAELPAPNRHGGTYESSPFNYYTADQLRQAYAQGAASQLGAEPVVFLAPSGHVYGMKVAAGTNSKPLFTLKEPK